MTDEQLLREGRADFDAAMDPTNPNSAIIRGTRGNSAPTFSVKGVIAQAKHADARMRQAARAAEKFGSS